MILTERDFLRRHFSVFFTGSDQQDAGIRIHGPDALQQMNQADHIDLPGLGRIPPGQGHRALGSQMADGIRFGFPKHIPHRILLGQIQYMDFRIPQKIRYPFPFQPGSADHMARPGQTAAQITADKSAYAGNQYFHTFAVSGQLRNSF